MLSDPRKRAYAAQFIGQAFVTAYNLIQANRAKIENVANAVIEKKEIYGDDLVRLLDAQNFEKPEIDWTAEETWPNLMNWSSQRRETPRGRAARSRARMSGLARSSRRQAAAPDRSSASGEQAGTATDPLVAAAAGTRMPGARAKRYERRFIAVYVGLGVVLVAAVAAFVVIVAQPGHKAAAAVVGLEADARLGDPDGEPDRRARRAPVPAEREGRPARRVVPSKPTVTSGTTNIAIKAIAIRKAPNTNTGIEVLQLDRRPRCSTSAGSASAARSSAARRPRRAAGSSAARRSRSRSTRSSSCPAINSIIAFMPPPPGQTATSVLFLRKENFKDALDRPLAQTLKLAAAAAADGRSTRPRARRSTQLTLPSLFSYELQALQTGGAALVLDPAT